MIPIDLKGMNAIVTGAASGLGKGVAIRLAEAGCAVGAFDYNFEGAQETAQEIMDMGFDSTAFKVDITDPVGFDKAVDEFVQAFDKLDILANCAGIGILKPILAFTQEDIDKLIDVDLKGVIYGMRSALRHMVPQKSGKIINLAGVAAKAGQPMGSVYAAAKNGVIALSNSLAREVAEHNININVVSPGSVRTNMWEAQLDIMTKGGDAAAKDKLFAEFSVNASPLKRAQVPEDIANMVVFLASELARNITAQDINVDGGKVIF